MLGIEHASCFYGWQKVFASMVVSLTKGCPMEQPNGQLVLGYRPCADLMTDLAVVYKRLI